MIKLPTIMETTPATKAMPKDKNSKAKMKAYADQKLQVKEARKGFSPAGNICFKLEI